MQKGLFLKIAKEIKYQKQENHIADYRIHQILKENNLQERLNEACSKDKSHMEILSQ